MNDCMACAAVSGDELPDVVDEEELTAGEPEPDESELEVLVLASVDTPTSARACMMLLIRPPPGGGGVAAPVLWALVESSVDDVAVLLVALICASHVLRLEMPLIVMLCLRVLVGLNRATTLVPVSL